MTRTIHIPLSQLQAFGILTIGLFMIGVYTLTIGNLIAATFMLVTTSVFTFVWVLEYIHIHQIDFKFKGDEE